MTSFRSRPQRWLVIVALSVLPACTFVDEKLLPAFTSPSLPAASSTPSGAGTPNKSGPAATVERADPKDASRNLDVAANAAGASTGMSCERADPGEYGPIGVIRFDPMPASFEAPLKAAVARLKDLRPEFGFHLVLKIPEKSVDDLSGADEVVAREHVEAVVYALADMGVPTRDVLFSGLTSAEITAYEMHVFPMRICREQTANANQRVSNFGEESRTDPRSGTVRPGKK